MSSLLAGSSSILPWIEDTCFRALLDGSSAQRPRLAQVIAMRLYQDDKNNNIPSFLVIHDGETSIVAFLSCQLSPSDTNGLPTKGCIVRISDWNVSLVDHCAGRHLPTLLAEQDAASYYLEVKPQLCLIVGKVEVLGCHGIGIVGNPVHIHQTIQVRRALMALHDKQISLQQRLKLVVPLGNVQDLFRPENSNALLETLLSTKHNAAAVSTTTATPTANGSPVPLGDVRVLLNSSTEDFDKIIQMAKQQNQENASTMDSSTMPATAAATTAAVTATADSASTSRASNNGDIVLGNVADLLAKHSMDDILAAAAALTPSAASDKHINETEEEEEEEEVIAQARAIEPYGIRERIESRASVVSLSGIQTLLSSVVDAGRRSFSLPNANTGEQEEKQSEPMGETNTKEVETWQSQSQPRDNDEEESGLEVIGISDMLISQTQEGLEETVVEEIVVEEIFDKEMHVQEMGERESVVEKGTVAVDTVVVDESALADHARKRRRIHSIQESKEMEQDGTRKTNVVLKEAVVEKTIVKAIPTNASQSNKRSLEEIQDRDSIADVQPATQPPAPPQESDDYVGGIEHRDENKQPKQVMQRSTKPPKKKRKGMLSLWKERRARRQEQSNTGANK